LPRQLLLALQRQHLHAEDAAVPSPLLQKKSRSPLLYLYLHLPRSVFGCSELDPDWIGTISDCLPALPCHGKGREEIEKEIGEDSFLSLAIFV